jgi:hypothetical protein
VEQSPKIVVTAPHEVAERNGLRFREMKESGAQATE